MLNRILLRSKLGDSNDAVLLKKQIEELTERELFRIDINRLADLAGKERLLWLNHFVTGTAKGIFSMQWICHCPECGYPARTTATLRDCRSREICPCCQAAFSNSLSDNMELTFGPTGDLAVLPEKYRKEYEQNLHDMIKKAGTLNWKGDETLSARNILFCRSFWEMMTEDTLSGSESLKTGKIAMLTIRYCNTRQMFEEKGDAAGFTRIKEFTDTIKELVYQHGGIPVRSTRDDLFVVFQDTAQAVTAAFSLKEITDFNTTDSITEKDVKLSQGIHFGEASLVTIDGKLDFSGISTLRGEEILEPSQPGQIILTQEAFESRSTRSVIRAKKETITRVHSRDNQDTTLYYRIN